MELENKMAPPEWRIYYWVGSSTSGDGKAIDPGPGKSEYVLKQAIPEGSAFSLRVRAINSNGDFLSLPSDQLAGKMPMRADSIPCAFNAKLSGYAVQVYNLTTGNPTSPPALWKLSYTGPNSGSVEFDPKKNGSSYVFSKFATPGAKYVFTVRGMDAAKRFVTMPSGTITYTMLAQMYVVPTTLSAVLVSPTTIRVYNFSAAADVDGAKLTKPFKFRIVVTRDTPTGPKQQWLDTNKTEVVLPNMILGTNYSITAQGLGGVNMTAVSLASLPVFVAT